MKNLKKKGQLDQLGGLVQTLGFLAVLLAIVFLVVAQLRTQVTVINPCGNTSAYYNSSSNVCQRNTTDTTVNLGKSHSLNATERTRSAMSDIPTWFSIVVITVIGGLLIGLIQYFRKK